MKPTAIVFLLCLFGISPNAISEDRPNVLFISVDDLNDWIGCLGGHPQALTPNMDRLAARGVLFTNAHCAAPACNPSRAAVFSGRKPQVSGVWSNESGSLKKSFPSARLLPEALSAGGYATFGTGKLYHRGSTKNFDEYYKVEQRWSPFSKKQVQYTRDELPSKGTNQPRHLLKDILGRDIVLPLNQMPSDRNPTKLDGESFDWGPFDVPDQEFGDTKITDWAIKKLKKGSEKPMFLAVGYYRPHIPLWAPKRFFNRFEKSPGQLPKILKDDLKDLSATARKWAVEPVTAGSHSTVVKHQQWQKAVEGYLACVTYVDSEIGRLLDALDRSSMSDNTVVILWSDHGWHLGEKQHWGKWTGWERSTKVPLIVAPPRKLSGAKALPQDLQPTSKLAKTCDEPVSLLDLYPTLVQMCRLTGPEKLDGISLVNLLDDPKLKTKRAVVTMFDQGNFSVRSSRHRYIRYQDGNEELYDHESDPHEFTNLVPGKTSQPELKSLRAVANQFEQD